MSRWPLRSIPMIAVLTVLVAAGTRAQEQQPQPPQQAPGAASTARSLDPPGGVLVAPGNAPDLIFLYTGDVIGHVEPCG